MRSSATTRGNGRSPTSRGRLTSRRRRSTPGRAASRVHGRDRRSTSCSSRGRSPARGPPSIRLDDTRTAYFFGEHSWGGPIIGSCHRVPRKHEDHHGGNGGGHGHKPHGPGTTTQTTTTTETTATAARFETSNAWAEERSRSA